MLFMRFVMATADAVGMNAILKGAEKVLEAFNQLEYRRWYSRCSATTAQTISRPRLMNWIEGRD